MIYQTPNNFHHSTFDQTFLINPRHRLIWFPGWLEIDLFVRRNEERLEWWGAPPAGLLMFHDSLCSYPGHSACGAWPERAGCDRGQQWAVASHYRVWPGTDIQLRPDMELSATERVATAAAGIHSATGTSRTGHCRCSTLCATCNVLNWNETKHIPTDINLLFPFILIIHHREPRPAPGLVIAPCGGSWVDSGLRPPGSALLSPTQTYNWNKSRTPPQNNHFSSLLSYIFIKFYDHKIGINVYPRITIQIHI